MFRWRKNKKKSSEKKKDDKKKVVKTPEQFQTEIDLLKIDLGLEAEKLKLETKRKQLYRDMIDVHLEEEYYLGKYT